MPFHCVVRQVYPSADPTSHLKPCIGELPMRITADRRMCSGLVLSLQLVDLQEPCVDRHDDGREAHQHRANGRAQNDAGPSQDARSQRDR